MKTGPALAGHRRTTLPTDFAQVKIGARLGKRQVNGVRQTSVNYGVFHHATTAGHALGLNV